ncbi:MULTISPECIES: MAPEG family protein [Brasilonema]|uniref:MAPEG family protein n=1 Tax=Brasilonema TaxID=383614 RepID=UPI001B7D26D1|nr:MULTISPECIES: MAPEG family protein [Brasilonema]
MIPISTLFIGLNGLIALLLTYIVMMERTRTRLWHGESKEDVAKQRDPLINPNVVAATVEKLPTKIIPDKVED